MKRASVMLACALALGASVLVVSDDVDACGNGVYRRAQENTQAIARAELLVNGDARQLALAVRIIRAKFPTIKKRQRGVSALGDRAMRVMARAIVRDPGGVDFGKAFPNASANDKAENINWAVRVLRAFRDKKPKDAGASTDLGEALAHGTLRQRKEAQTLLASLEARDLMASARGYAALAELRRGLAADRPAFIRAPVRALEAARERIAAARCRKMTKDPSLCGASPPHAS